jgi:Putative prokaryotic signal transducing protein
MYCPNCTSEYRTGFTWCKDCDVALVAELPAAEKTEFVDLVEVLSIADAGQIPLIKSILEAEEIPYLAQGENFNLARNLPVRFLVPGEYFAQARDVLVDFL